MKNKNTCIVPYSIEPPTRRPYRPRNWWASQSTEREDAHEHPHAPAEVFCRTQFHHRIRKQRNICARGVSIVQGTLSILTQGKERDLELTHPYRIVTAKRDASVLANGHTYVNMAAAMVKGIITFIAPVSTFPIRNLWGQRSC